MFEKLGALFKKLTKAEQKDNKTKDTAKERLHLVLMQDRANVSVDFLEMMKQEIIEVIKKYIDVDENAIDVRLTNKTNDDGTTGAPALYANIPFTNVKTDVEKVNITPNTENSNTNATTTKKINQPEKKEQQKIEEKQSEKKEENKQEKIEQDNNKNEEENKEEEKKENNVTEEKIEEANKIINNTSEDD